jgi:hypothetical protein
MDTLLNLLDTAKSYANWYRYMAYYYIGYRIHELRVPAPSKHESKKLAAIKRNDISLIKEKVYSGEWKVDDVVSINNMSTMIHEAVVMDRRDIFDFLIRQGADPNTRDRNGMTPLLKAAALGRLHMVEGLIRVGVNPHQRDPHGFTPLSKAKLHEEWKAAELLEGQVFAGKGTSRWLWPPDV